jgi:hypothetical protein
MEPLDKQYDYGYGYDSDSDSDSDDELGRIQAEFILNQDLQMFNGNTLDATSVYNDEVIKQLAGIVNKLTDPNFQIIPQSHQRPGALVMLSKENSSPNAFLKIGTERAINDFTLNKIATELGMSSIMCPAVPVKVHINNTLMKEDAYHKIDKKEGVINDWGDNDEPINYVNSDRSCLDIPIDGNLDRDVIASLQPALTPAATDITATPLEIAKILCFSHLVGLKDLTSDGIITDENRKMTIIDSEDNIFSYPDKRGTNLPTVHLPVLEAWKDITVSADDLSTLNNSFMNLDLGLIRGRLDEWKSPINEEYITKPALNILMGRLETTKALLSSIAATQQPITIIQLLGKLDPIYQQILDECSYKDECSRDEHSSRSIHLKRQRSSSAYSDAVQQHRDRLSSPSPFTYIGSGTLNGISTENLDFAPIHSTGPEPPKEISNGSSPGEISQDTNTQSPCNSRGSEEIIRPLLGCSIFSRAPAVTPNEDIEAKQSGHTNSPL